MIGTVTYHSTNEEDAAVATLHEDGRWTFAGDPVPIARLEVAILALDYAYAGPSAGPFGVELLHLLAERVDGTLKLRKPRAQEPGLVY